MRNQDYYRRDRDYDDDRQFRSRGYDGQDEPLAQSRYDEDAARNRSRPGRDDWRSQPRHEDRSVEMQRREWENADRGRYARGERGQFGQWDDSRGADREGGNAYRSGRDRQASFDARGQRPDDRGAYAEIGNVYGRPGPVAPPQLAGVSHRGKGPKGYSRNDNRIREDICDRLSDDESVDASDIEVTVKGGEVTLKGTVDSRQAKRRAEDCVEDCSGVKQVQNLIRVAEEAVSTTSEAQA